MANFKTLYLVRHALPEESGRLDALRKLTTKGMNDAIALGKWLQNQTPTPEHIMASDAIRAKQTAEAILEAFPTLKANAAFDSDWYQCSSHELLKAIQNVDDSINTLLFVNHNPTVSMLIAELSHTQPTWITEGACAQIQFEIDTWQGLQHGLGELKGIYNPDYYNK
ncbi:MAG: histidine phosphatase family protein [Bernardetiaceae bacterium]|nr:histidine phosphatase family protein [Bernardetiaceae bacterium]